MNALLPFFFFTGLVAILTWRMTRKDDHQTRSGYFLAGRSLTWLFIGGSLLLTNLSTEQLVGLNGGGYTAGMQVMAWEVLAGLSMIFMALVMLPRYLGKGVTTVSEFLEQRYDKTVRLIIAVVLILSLFTNLLPFVLYSGAIFMREVFDIPAVFKIGETTALWIIVAALGIVGAIYAIFGGLKAVAVSDTLNGIGLFVGGLAVPIFGLIYLGGDEGMMGGIRKLTENHKELLNPIGEPSTDRARVPVSTFLTGMIFINLYYWCTNQAIVQRTFGAKSLAHGQKGLLFAAGLKMLGPFYLVLPGIIAFHLFAGQNIKPDDAYGMLVNTVLPTWMIGFFCAVVFGAILSSFNSGLNSATTLFSVDLYRHFKPDSTEREVVKAGKIFGIAAAAVVICVAPLIDLTSEDSQLFNLMKEIAALYNVPLIVITAVGMLVPRAPTIAAKVVLVFGFTFYIVFGWYFGNTIFGHKFHWLHIAGINGYLCILIMLLFAAFLPREVPASGSRGKAEVDVTPWKGAKGASLAIGLVVLALYFGLYRVAN